MNKETLLTKFSELKSVINNINCFNIIGLLELLSINISDFDNRLDVLKENLHLNNHILDDNIIEDSEILYLSSYATYCFIDKIHKSLFENISTYKNTKSYFYTKDFDGWANDKKNIDKEIEDLENIKYLNPKEIWDCKIGINIGGESNGKGKHMRPVLILQKVGMSFVVLPLTKHGKIETERNGKFYHKLEGYFDIDSFVMLSQLKTIDKKRCIKHMKTISDNDHNIIIEKVKDLYFPTSNEDIQ